MISYLTQERFARWILKYVTTHGKSKESFMPMHSSCLLQYSDHLSLSLNEACRTNWIRNTNQSWISQSMGLWMTVLDLFAWHSEFLLMCPQLLQTHTRCLSGVRLSGDGKWVILATNDLLKIRVFQWWHRNFCPWHSVSIFML